MSATTTVTALGIVSLLGFTSLAVFPQGETVPWKEIVGTGSAGCVLLAMWMSHKHTEKVTDNFSETVTALFKENRDDNKENRAADESARRELQELIRDLRRPNQAS